MFDLGNLGNFDGLDESISDLSKSIEEAGGRFEEMYNLLKRQSEVLEQYSSGEIFSKAQLEYIEKVANEAYNQGFHDGVKAVK